MDAIVGSGTLPGYGDGFIISTVITRVLSGTYSETDSSMGPHMQLARPMSAYLTTLAKLSDHQPLLSASDFE